MKPSSLYTLMQRNEHKLPVIDQITSKHPGYGTKMEWSYLDIFVNY